MLKQREPSLLSKLKLISSALFWLTYIKFCTKLNFNFIIKKHLSTKTQNFSIAANPLTDHASALRALSKARQMLPFKCQCIVTSICFRKLCQLIGISSTVHIGFYPLDADIACHAWVSVNGVIVLNKTDINFKEIVKFD